MARPRRVVPGNIYMITRRVAYRMFRLRPSRDTNQVLEYCLAYAASQTGVRVLAYGGMSNHHHPTIQDPECRLSDFLHLLHMLTAKALNALQGMKENVWATEPTSAVLLGSPEDVLDKIAYVAANPVEAGLVRRPQDWPGVMHFLPATVRIKRPACFGRDLPAEVVLRIVHPLFADASPREWFIRVKKAVRERVREARERVEGAGRTFLGRKRILAQPLFSRADSEEQRGIRPRVAAKDPKRRKVLLALEKGFQQAYRVALDAWTTGLRDTKFPYGTWWMRVHHGAGVDPPDRWDEQ